MELHKEDLKAVGLQLLAISLGEPKHAQHFCGKLAPSQTCFSSTINDPYYTWGLYQYTGKDTLLNAGKLMTATLQAMAHGQSQGEATGDIAMSTGTFIVDTSGVVRYAYYGKVAGDDPDIDDLVKAARMLNLKS